MGCALKAWIKLLEDWNVIFDTIVSNYYVSAVSKLLKAFLYAPVVVVSLFACCV